MSDSTPSGTSGFGPVSRRHVLVGGATAMAGAACFSGSAAAQGLIVAVIPTPDRWSSEDLAGFEIRLSNADGGGTDSGGDGSDGAGTDGAGGEGGDGDADGGDADAGDGDAGGTATGAGETDGDATAAGDGGTDGTDVGGTDAGDVPQCDVADWPPEEVASHEATLVNRQEEDTPGVDTTLYVSADVDVEGDAPYVVNMAEDCESDYVGLELETSEGAIEQDDDPQEVEEDDPQDAEGGQDDTPRRGDDGTGVFGPGFGVPAVVAGLLGWGLLRRRNRERSE